MKTKKTFFKAFLLMLVCFSLSSAAFASHFRHGTISWQQVSGNTIQFKISQAYAGYRTVGSSGYYDRIDFGDGSYQYFNITVTSSNQSENWHYGEATVTHTYSNSGNYTAFFQSCCKIYGMVNNSSSSWRNETVVNVGSGNNAPVVTMAPIVSMQGGQNSATFQIPAVDPDGDNLTYRLATYNEILGSQPSGLSVNSSTGMMTFNTSSTIVGQLYNAAVVVEDGQTKVINDFIIKIVQQSNPPVFDYGITPTNGTVYQTSPGQTVSFSIKAGDTDPGSSVTLTSVGVPLGAAFSPALPLSGNPVQSTFSWTPTTSDLGTNVVNFLAQDNLGTQVNTSVSILVSMKPKFDVPPTPASGTHNIVVSPGSQIQYSVQASDPDSTDVVQIISMQGKDSNGNKISIYSGATFNNMPTAAANPTTGTFSWTPTAAQWGHRHVYFTAEDSYGDKTVHEVYQLVNTPPVFSSSPVNTADLGSVYTYNISLTDQDMAYGDQLSINGVALPSWLSLTDNGNGTATLSGTPSLADIGTVAITIQAEDMHHHDDPRGSINQTFNLTVNNCTINASAQDLTIGLDQNGTASIAASQINNGSSASCGLANVSISNSTFDCNNIGANNVTLTVFDANGDSATANAVVTVEDNQSPYLSSVQGSSSISLPYGQTSGWSPWNYGFFDPTPAGAVITGADLSFSAVDQGWGGSGAWAGFYVAGQHIGSAQLYHYTQSFNLSYQGGVAAYNDGGINSLQMTFVGWPGWQAKFMGGTLTLHYSIGATTGNSITVQLDANGQYIVSPSQIDPGFIDNCGIASLSLDQSAFDCSHIGNNAVTLTATDYANNSTSINGQVTVEDNVVPTALAQNITVQLDANGNVSITANDIDNGSNDACGIATLSVSPSTFSCSEVGANTVSLTATDNNGNTASTTATVTVEDNFAPTALTQDISVQLDVNGNASITANDIDNGSNDACGIANLSVDQSSFDCTQLGSNSVSLSVRDNNGNISVASANVTVEDLIAPTISCPANITVVAQANDCNPIINWTDPTVWDNCSYTISSTHTSGDRFNEGTTTVTYSVTDAGGNISQCSFDVTVNTTPLSLSLTSPTFIGGNNISCNGSADGSIDATTGGGCLPYTFNWSNSGNTEDISGLTAGSYSVTMTDAKGRTITQSMNLTEPTPLTASISASPQFPVAGLNAYTIYLGYGAQSINLSTTASGSTPAYTYAWSPSSTLSSASTSATVATPTVPTSYTVTVTDMNGCTTTESFFIDVVDARCGNKMDKVLVCHKTSKRVKGVLTTSYHNICVSTNAVAAHLAHGDNLGSCPSARNKSIDSIDEPELLNTVGLEFAAMPNPTANQSKIEFSSNENSHATLIIYDISGKEMAVLFNQNIEAGLTYQTNFNGSELAGGIYLARLTAGNEVKIIKIVLTK